MLNKCNIVSFFLQGSFGWPCLEAGPFPVSCLYQVPPLIPGNTLFSADTQQCVCVCYIFSVSSFTLLICKQALIVSRVTCSRAHSIQARTFWCCETSAALFCIPVAAPPRVFLEWHHTVSCFSVHSPAHHNAYVRLKLFANFSTSPWVRPKVGKMENTMYESRNVCATYGWPLLCLCSLFLCVYLVLTLVVQILSWPVKLFMCVFSFQESQCVTGLWGFGNAFQTNIIFANLFRHLF